VTDAIRQWVEDQTGLTAIWLNPNAPRPDRPYASLQIINVARKGEADRGRLDDQGQVDVYLQREVTVSVQIYDDAADPRSALTHRNCSMPVLNQGRHLMFASVP